MCTDCSTSQVLIGKNQAGEPTCGPCAGVSTDYTCRTCGRPGDLYLESTCHRCVLKHRVRDLLSGPDGAIDPRLEGLHQALCAVPAPRSTLVWLSRCPAARLLVELAQRPDLISHGYLDRSPHGQAAHYLRGILVRTGLLPERDEHLERIGPWADRLLTEQPAHAQLIRPFTHWYLLPRTRRRARRRRFTIHSARTPRAQILAALEFLTWLHDHGTTLDAIAQGDIDVWLTTGPPRHYDVAAFLHWAADRRLTAVVGVPRRRSKGVGQFLDHDQHTHQLRRCLQDTTLPLDVRVTGALVLLFGPPVSRIVALTTADLEHRDTGLYLTLGVKPIQLPPALAALLQKLLDQPRDPSAVSIATGPTPYLFPGMIAGRPATPAALAGKLNRHGIATSPARNTARRALAEQLPAAVIADLFDMHINTAINWTRHTKIDWTLYRRKTTPGDPEDTQVGKAPPRADPEVHATSARSHCSWSTERSSVFCSLQAVGPARLHLTTRDSALGRSPMRRSPRRRENACLQPLPAMGMRSRRRG